MQISTLTKVIALLGGIFSLTVVGLAGDWSTLALVLLGLVFAAWTTTPFAILFAQARRLSESPWGSAVLLAAAIAALAVSVAAYWRPFIAKTNLDAQDGIILAVLPLYQLMGVGLAVAIAAFIARK